LNSVTKNQVFTALFVDFDNIFITLQQHDPQAANEFATNPDRWLSWLEEELPTLYDEKTRRRILIRRCYLNPQSFANFRPYFIRAAFEVTDCPPLTTRGKTSTDIHMVMDILDALHQDTPFDEFIILSGDADFTPVLLRIRKHGRYSAALSVGYVSPAYKSATDLSIAQDAFIREALGIREADEDEEEFEGKPEFSADLKLILERMGDRIYQEANTVEGVQAADLPDIYKEFQEFRQNSHWLGYKSLRRLTEAILSQRDDLTIVEEDPWRVTRAVKQRVFDGETTGAGRSLPEIKNAMSDWIHHVVADSENAVLMGTLAQGISQRFREQLNNTDWLGAGTFKSLLGQLNLGQLKTSSINPGFVYDPARHRLPGAMSEADSGRPDTFMQKHPELAPLARKVQQLTDTPYILPEQYTLLFQELAREINKRGYQMVRTSKIVRDRCVEKGAPISRSIVNFVLVGINNAGHTLGRSEKQEASKLAEALVKNTLALCQNAQFNLTDEETEQVRNWLTGGLKKKEYPK
jgi:uncharacterized LabA/DUF88 family protein